MKHKLTLPLPPKELSPNASKPWSSNARWFHIKARSEYREMVALSCFGQRVATGNRYRMTETYRFADKRKRDVRNLFAAFKAGEDGLVDAGLLPGDDDSVLEHGPPRIERVKTKAEEGVVVEIEEIG